VYSRLSPQRFYRVAGTHDTADGGIAFTDVVRLDGVDRCMLLCVPGGFGTIAALADQQYLTQLRRRSDFALSSVLVCERCNKLVYEMTSARVTV
jgi:hypothetical protein